MIGEKTTLKVKAELSFNKAKNKADTEKAIYYMLKAIYYQNAALLSIELRRNVRKDVRLNP